MEMSLGRLGGKRCLDEAAESKKREKKRIQNRNSQKLSREKQASYTRALEHIVNSLENTDPDSSPMIKTMIQMREENQKLRNLVLRMRKRFLSLSTMAATDADDCALDAIPQTEIKGNIETQQAALLTPGSIHNSTGHPSEQPTEQPTKQPTEQPGLNGTYPGRQEPPRAPTPISIPSYNDFPFKNPTELDASLLPTLQEKITATSLLSLSTPKKFSTPSIYYDSDIHDGETPSSLTHGVQTLLRTETSIRKIFLEMECAGKLTPQTASRVLVPAIRLMLRNTPLEGYIYAFGSHHYLEPVMHWRIRPSIETRDAIPQTFLPTVLQQHFQHRHPFVDFVPWDFLRDQILLYPGNLNLPQLLSDILQNFVHDIVELNAAIPLFQTYVELEEGYCATTAGGPASYLEEKAKQLNSVFYSVTSVVQKYGLDDYQQRKLNPEFSKKYPFFDIERVKTKLPIVPYSIAIANRS